MKSFFAAAVCCVLFVASVSAQEVLSIVETPDSDVQLTSVQEPTVDVQPSASDVMAAPTVMDSEAPQTFGQDGAVYAAPIQMDHSAVVGNPCGGCSPVVTNYAASINTGCNNCATPVANNNCGQADCCPSRGFSRPYIIRSIRGRFTRANNCCN